MAIEFQQNGHFSINYEGPYQGLDVSAPATLISDKASPSFLNFMLRNQELRSRPNFPVVFPDNPGGTVLGLTNFVDINGTYHVVYWSGNKLYQYQTGAPPAFALVGTAAPANLQQNTVKYRAFANVLYYTSISQPIGSPRPAFRPSQCPSFLSPPAKPAAWMPCSSSAARPRPSS